MRFSSRVKYFLFRSHPLLSLLFSPFCPILCFLSYSLLSVLFSPFCPILSFLSYSLLSLLSSLPLLFSYYSRFISSRLVSLGYVVSLEYCVAINP